MGYLKIEKHIYDFVVNNVSFKNWIEMLMDFFISASSSLMAIAMAFFGLSIASELGIFNTKAIASFVEYDTGVIVFISIYAIIIATIAWYTKKQIKDK